MGIETWIDLIVDRWRTIEDPRGGNLRAYYVFKQEEFPEAITEYPCALTYVTDLSGDYSAGGSREHWNGTTEFHLVSDVGKHHYPYIMRWFALIRNAVLGSVSLGGSVSHFMPQVEGGPFIQGPVVLQYGSDAPHLGLVANWIVKEQVTVTVTA